MAKETILLDPAKPGDEGLADTSYAPNVDTLDREEDGYHYRDVTPIEDHGIDRIVNKDDLNRLLKKGVWTLVGSRSSKLSQ